MHILPSNHIIIISAPSGGGKTTLSKRLIAQGFAKRSHDFKRFQFKLKPNDIVELSTNKWYESIASERWIKLLKELDNFEHIYCISLKLPSRRELAKRYLKRLILEYPRKHLLKPRAWIHGFSYLLTNKLYDSEDIWLSFESYLRNRYLGRVTVIELISHSEPSPQDTNLLDDRLRALLVS